MQNAATALRVLSPRPLLTGGGSGDSLQNVNTTLLPNGALCLVTENSTLYRLDKTSTSNVGTITPGSGPGRWFPLAGSEVAFDVTNDPSATIASGATISQFVAVSGVLATDKVSGIDVPAAVLETGVIVNAAVTADNQLVLVYVNGTSAGIPLSSATFRVFLQRA